MIRPPRIYAAICELLEALAARARTDTLEAEFDNLDMAEWVDDED